MLIAVKWNCWGLAEITISQTDTSTLFPKRFTALIQEFFLGSRVTVMWLRVMRNLRNYGRIWAPYWLVIEGIDSTYQRCALFMGTLAWKRAQILSIQFFGEIIPIFPYIWVTTWSNCPILILDFFSNHRVIWIFIDQGAEERSREQGAEELKF